MKAGVAGKLYTPELLGLAVELGRFPLDTSDWQWRGEARSRTCGSRANIGVNLDEQGLISEAGMQLSACVMGQSSAAVMLQNAKGRSTRDIRTSRDGLQGWLSGQGELPEWPGLKILIPAREFSGRHGAILLPWNAMLDALSKAEASG